MSPLVAANLALRFALELAALGAVGAWAWSAGSGWTRPLLAAAAVGVVAVAWGAFVSPKRAVELGAAGRLAVELAVWLAAGAALAGVGPRALGVAFVAVAVASGAINHRATA